jgi:hypothetical protein
MSQQVFAFGSNMCSGRFRAYGVSAEGTGRAAVLLGYSGKGEHRFRREAERHSGAKVNSSRSAATLTR